MKRKISASRGLLQDLVAGSRILAMHKVLDAYGHVSARSDRRPERFVMSRALAPALVTAADLMELDADSEALPGDKRKGFLERFIHGEIYRARPEVMAIVHSHSASVIPFGVTRSKLRPIYHMGAFLWSGAPVFDIRKVTPENDLLIRDRSLGRSLAGSLGACSCVLMRGHGMTVVGESVPEAVFRAVYTEMNARLQIQAQLLEGPIEFLSEEEGRRSTAINRSTLERPWQLWKRELSRR
ncbi:MAG: class II aldolase/adducin family protein [Betaproteobacteria bacterium]|nr:class II aldolase/adducin family protein [Betaproteobacteria bacterium]MSQ88057.1 class II aldolase/adducin family protein [Betaproteobacteria bacterium]